MDKTPFLYVAISATLFGVSAPLAKILLDDISPVALAGLLYLGAFLGLFVYSLVRLALRSTGRERRTVPLERADVPYLAGAVITGGVLGPILLMWGLSMTTGFATSLMLNLEAVATGVIAVVVFREHSGARLGLALGLITIGGILLAWDPELGKFTLAGPLLVTLAMVCWGMDNNLTRAISSKDAVQITMIKGAVAGSVSLGIALALGAAPSLKPALVWALLLGAFSIGISLVLFIRALERLGSARTGAFFAVAPFVGALVSLIVLGEWLGWVMLPTTLVMAVGVWLIVGERHSHEHKHETQVHDHIHTHDDMHHPHPHEGAVEEPHCHPHVHEVEVHDHVHWPDEHHRHIH